MKLRGVTGDMQFEHAGGGAASGLPASITAGPQGGRVFFEPGEPRAEKFLVLTVEGRDADALLVMLEFFTGVVPGALRQLLAGAAGLVPHAIAHEDVSPQARCMFSFLPGLPVTTCLPLGSLASQSLPREPRTPGRLRRGLWGERLDPREVGLISLQLGPYYRSRSLRLLRFELAEQPPDCSLSRTPILVDSLGQLTFRAWETKTTSTKELVRCLRGARRRAAARISRPPGDGRERQDRFDATGYFRTEHDGRRWWLVTPAGRAFYSLGINCVRPGEAGYIGGMEALLAWLPERAGPFAAAHGDASYFDFARANLIRAFGEDWWQGWAELTRARLWAWGVNTVGNWSDRRFLDWAGMPYVLDLQGFPGTGTNIYRDFPDVFSEAFRQGAAAYAQQLTARRRDPYMVGYFMTNEPYWAVGESTNLARELFRRPGKLASKDRLVTFLRQRYGDDIQRLNAGWATELLNFGEVCQLRHAELAAGGAVEEDLLEFTRIMIEEYVRVPAAALRRVDANHLNLGLRYARIQSAQVFTGHRHLDVFSLNGYTLEPPPDLVERAHDVTGKPVIIGEFHFGAPDAGPCRFGVRSVASQAARGRAYRRYVEQGAALPALVGTHYFQHQDQPPLGRRDGEAYQIGVVDICHRPYAPLVSAMAASHRKIYAVAAGEEEPFRRRVDELRTRWW